MEQKPLRTLKLPRDYKQFDYDQWLDYFRAIPVRQLVSAQQFLMETIPGDGYAAAARWIEISREPSKMDKLHKAQLKRHRDESVMQLAVGDDDEAFYEALIKENVEQLNSGASPQEVARLTQNVNIFRKELREIRSRRPKKGTILEQVLKKAASSSKSETEPKKKPPKGVSEPASKRKTKSVSSAKDKAAGEAYNG